MATIKITDENFTKEVVESKIPVLIDFWAEWCGPCQMMGPVFEELSGEYDEKLKFAKLNTDNFGNIAQDYGIRGIPCLILTIKGKEQGRITGFAPKDAIKQKIDQLLK